jgi:cytochrome o ubiquinol oxidase subunit IV
MTETRHDRAPGDSSAFFEQEAPDAVIYTIGLVLAVILTAISFWVANTSLLWGPGIALGLAVLAIAQMGVHLVFFLHITTGPDTPTTCWRWRLVCSSSSWSSPARSGSCGTWTTT